MVLYSEVIQERLYINVSIFNLNYWCMTVMTRACLCDFYVPALLSLSRISLYFSLNVYIISHVRKICGLLIFSFIFFKYRRWFKK